MKFLSAQWIEALDQQLRSAKTLESADHLAIGQVVTDSPFGEVRYTVVIDGAPHVIPNSTEEASVTIVTDYETAAAIARGEPTAELLYRGRLKITGDVNALLAAQTQLGELTAALSSLAADTDF